MNRKVLTNLLGTVPTDPWGNELQGHVDCAECGEAVPVDHIAWGTYDFAPDTGSEVLCIECAVKAAMETERPEVTS